MKPLGTTFYIKTESNRTRAVRETQLTIGYVLTNYIVKSINNSNFNPIMSSNPKLICDTFLKKIREKINEAAEDY